MSEQVMGDCADAHRRHSQVEPASGLQPSAECQLSRVRVTEVPARCFTVRDGWAWAHLFLREGISTSRDGSPRHWADLAIISDFGTFGYCWTHMGSSAADFLPRLGFDYAMGKLAGRGFFVPLAVEDARRKVRGIVLDQRRTGCMSKEDARELWNAAEACDEQTTFLQDLDLHSGGAMYRHELWDYRWEEPSPQARGFWREIWPHFIAALCDSGSDRQAKTPQAAEGEASQSGPAEEQGIARPPGPSLEPSKETSR